MRILLTNDDGFNAPGIIALHKELRKIGDVTIAAPAVEQSAASHSLTIHSAVLVHEVFEGDGKKLIGWAVEGKPADCVKAAILELLGETPDLVVSGLNAGSNSGINVLYSGTVAAATESAFYGITSIACSLEYKDKIFDFDTGARHARETVEKILANNPAKGSLFNVNIPVLENGPIRGVIVVPQNITPFEEQYIRRQNPRGKTYFWTGPDFRCIDPVPNTDVTLLGDQYITVTPLTFDRTDYAKLSEMQNWEWQKIQN